MNDTLFRYTGAQGWQREWIVKRMDYNLHNLQNSSQQLIVFLWTVPSNSEIRNKRWKKDTA